MQSIQINNQEYKISKPASLLNADKDSFSFYSGMDFTKIEESKAKIIICKKEIARIHQTKILIPSLNPRLDFIKTIVKANIRPIIPKIIFGKDVHVEITSVIGSDGFSYERDEFGILHKFPHYGGVEIGNNVDIGANACIDRGTFENTIIGDGTKIDNLVHIAHNVKIGKNCVIIAGSVIGGSCVIGDNCWISPNACIRDGIKIGNNVLVGMGAVVLEDIEDNWVVYGIPTKRIRKGKS